MGILGSFYEAFLNRVHIVIGIISYRSKVRNIFVIYILAISSSPTPIVPKQLHRDEQKIAESIMETQLDSLDSAVKQL